jgi:hypothetical protein
MGQNAAGKMAEVVAPFIGPKRRRREGRRCGEGNGRRCFINVPVTGEEVRGQPFDEGDMKGVGRRFVSTPTGCGRAMDGGAQSGGKPGSDGSIGGGRRPRVGQAGPNHQITRVGKEKFQEKEKNKQATRKFWARLILCCAEKKKKIFGF